MMATEKKERELVRVYDKDGTHRTLAVQPDMSCNEVVVLFGKKIAGFQPARFSLSVEQKQSMFAYLLLIYLCNFCTTSSPTFSLFSCIS